MEYVVRTARITDVDRLAGLGRAVLRGPARPGPLDAADLLRQLVYLPHASVFVAEQRREIVGGAVLVLRPSIVVGGYVGTVDYLVTDPAHDADRITEVLLEEILRSAGNKGCAVVETVQPEAAEDLARWTRLGFQVAGPRLERAVPVSGLVGRRP